MNVHSQALRGRHERGRGCAVAFRFAGARNTVTRFMSAPVLLPLPQNAKRLRRKALLPSRQVCVRPDET